MLKGGRQRHQAGTLGIALLVCLPLLGCSGMPGMGDKAEVTGAPPARIMDPIAGFAAEPPTNGQAQVYLADRGETVTLRLARQYAAASGRECREVRVTQRGGDNLRLYCRASSGWIEARPLIAQTVGQ